MENTHMNPAAKELIEKLNTANNDELFTRLLDAGITPGAAYDYAWGDTDMNPLDLTGDEF